MSCPYLKKIEAYYCEAFPQKVLIPGKPDAGDSCQSNGGFRRCSIFEEHEEKINKNFQVVNQKGKQETCLKFTGYINASILLASNNDTCEVLTICFYIKEGGRYEVN